MSKRGMGDMIKEEKRRESPAPSCDPCRIAKPCKVRECNTSLNITICGRPRSASLGALNRLLGSRVKTSFCFRSQRQDDHLRKKSFLQFSLLSTQRDLVVSDTSPAAVTRSAVGLRSQGHSNSNRTTSLTVTPILPLLATLGKQCSGDKRRKEGGHNA